MPSPLQRCVERLLAIGLTALCLGVASPALAQTAPQRADEPRFDIFEFVVVGDTVLGATAIENAVYAFLGPQRTAADAEGARRALAKAYQDAGFLSVNVVLPPQRVDQSGGEVRLQVVQAPVERLRVTGAQYTLPSQVIAALPNLAQGVVPNFNEMQQELALLARSSADREITPIIAAGEQPGTMNVELKVQDSLPLHGSVELNNKQSLNTVAGRLEAGLSYDNLFQAGHSVGLNWFYSPRRPDEADIRSLTYHLPVGGAGDRLYGTWLNSNSDTPTPLGGATVSRGDTWRLRWRDELPGRDGLSQALTWGVTRRDLQDQNRDVAGFSTPAPPLRYTTLNATYELELSGAALGAKPGRSSRLQTDLTVSLPGMNSREVDCFGSTLDQFGCQRSGATARFQVLGLSLLHREPLGRWTASVRVQGQFADSPLVPAEQVVYGGLDSVRGYFEGEQSGDLGAALRAELISPAWQPLERLSLRAQTFYDVAALQRLQPLPSEEASKSLASVGFGLKLESTFGLQGALQWAHVLRDSGRSQRWDLSLRQAF